MPKLEVIEEECQWGSVDCSERISMKGPLDKIQNLIIKPGSWEVPFQIQHGEEAGAVGTSNPGTRRPGPGSKIIAA
jgi:hypothetical protein